MKAQDNRPTQFLLPPQMTQTQLASFKKRYAFTEIAQLGFGITYKSRWDTWSAIREFVQNALDVITERHKDRQSLSNIALEYTTGIGYIIDNESGIKYRNMFLAENKERTMDGGECLRGKFGEGMKFALIPLLRDGHAVMIRTVGYDYHFSSVAMGEEDFDLIHLFQLPNKITSGTCIAISGVDPTEYRDRFIPLRLTHQPSDLLLEVNRGCRTRQILKKAEATGLGRFYIRDIYICEIESLYDYNFWFENPAKVLDPDRNSIRFTSGTKESFLKEFVLLLRELDTPVGYDFWGVFFKRMMTVKEDQLGRLQDLFEYQILDYSSTEDAKARFREAEKLFNCMAESLGTRSFGWSQDYSGGKELEHHDVLDLQNKLPDLSYWLRDYVLTPEKIKNLRRLEINKEIIIVPDDFQVLGKKAVEAVRNIYLLLHFIAMQICGEMQTRDEPNVYLYMGGSQEDKRIARVGHTNYETINLSWNPVQSSIRLLQRKTHRTGGRRGRRRISSASIIKRRLKSDANDTARNLMKTLLHELTHYCCRQVSLEERYERDCGDLTQEFENTMEDIMMAYSTVRIENFGGLHEHYLPIPHTSIEKELVTLFEIAQKNLLKVKEVEDLWASATNRLERQNTITNLELGGDDLSYKPLSWRVTPAHRETIKVARKELISRALRRRSKPTS